MRTDIVKMYKDVHTWVGIISGLALFIAFYAGAITMFETQLERWATPPADISAPPALEDVDTLIAKVHEAYPETRDNYQVQLYPAPDRPARVTWQPPRPRSREMFTNTDFNAASLDAEGNLEVVTLERSQMAQLIDVLHQQVGLPFEHEIAMPIMGAIALLYAVALVSGVIVLMPSLIKDLFILRRGKNLKRMWLDAHNVLGIFSLPFHIIMAVTAVIFAFHDQIYDTQYEAVYGAERVPELWEVGEVPFPKHADDARRLTPSEVVARMNEQAPGFTPMVLSYRKTREGDKTLLVEGMDTRYIVRGPVTGMVYIDPVTGDLLRTDYMPGMQDGWHQTVISFFALHFGTYGGMPVRWAYFFLGLAGAFLFYTGNLLWIESRRKKARRGKAAVQRRDVRILGSLTVGVSLGSIAGISVTIAAAKWLPAFGLATGPVHMAVYYAVFLLCVAWAFLRGAALAGKELMYACAGTTLLIPLTSAVALLWPTGPVWNHGSLETLMVDIVALLMALSFVIIARRAAERVKAGPTDSIWSAGDAPTPAPAE